ncbi:transposase [bacterium]|nr:MAG: transposase [bacterium]
MSQSLAKILIHAVFSTKERHSFLRDAVLRTETHSFLGGILGKLGCPPIIVGGAEDHVHLLFALGRTCAVSDVMKETKRVSSVWIKSRNVTLLDFAWQSGFGAFSIGYSQLNSVRAYIARQESHHRRVSFQDEFRKMLTNYKVAFDERYVWD